MASLDGYDGSGVGAVAAAVFLASFDGYDDSGVGAAVAAAVFFVVS